LKQARSAKLAEDILGSEAGDTYTEMLDQERARQLSAQMNLGIADALFDQFSSRIKK
jgi:Rod binding domain-containing protein